MFILYVLIILCLNILYYTLCNVWYNMCNIQNNQRVILLISLTCWRPCVTRQQRYFRVRKKKPFSVFGTRSILPCVTLAANWQLTSVCAQFVEVVATLKHFVAVYRIIYHNRRKKTPDQHRWSEICKVWAVGLTLAPPVAVCVCVLARLANIL